MAELDVASYNVRAWNHQVAKGNRWTLPVDAEAVAAARRGDWSLVLTPKKPVPAAWFGDVAGARVLALASGGGQQGPILAAAGANVVVFDASDRQLEQDRIVAEREGLDLARVQGDMRDLSAFEDAAFDLVFHPVSNCFCPEIRPVWREVARVLRPGGALLAGFVHPLLYQLDPDLLAEGKLQVAFAMPYSDVGSLSEEQLARYTDVDDPLVYGHSLEDQIGGQLDAGLILTGYYEDRGSSGPEAAADEYFAPFVATRAVKPG